MEKLISNFQHFARYNRADTENFSQFSPEIRSSIYISLAETVLCHWDLKDRFRARDNANDEIIYKDIFDFYQIFNANYEQMRSHDFSKIFIRINKQRNIKYLMEDSMNLILNEIKELISVTISQDKMIENILLENKSLKDELKKITNVLESSKSQTNNLFNTPFPPLMLSVNTNTQCSWSNKINPNTSLWSNQVNSNTSNNQIKYWSPMFTNCLGND